MTDFIVPRGTGSMGTHRRGRGAPVPEGRRGETALRQREMSTRRPNPVTTLWPFCPGNLPPFPLVGRQATFSPEPTAIPTARPAALVKAGGRRPERGCLDGRGEGRTRLVERRGLALRRAKTVLDRAPRRYPLESARPSCEKNSTAPCCSARQCRSWLRHHHSGHTGRHDPPRRRSQPR